jgi:hypothetical protein
MEQVVTSEFLDSIEEMILSSENDLQLAYGIIKSVRTEDPVLRKRKVNLQIAIEILIKGEKDNIEDLYWLDPVKGEKDNIEDLYWLDPVKVSNTRLSLRHIKLNNYHWRGFKFPNKEVKQIFKKWKINIL